MSQLADVAVGIEVGANVHRALKKRRLTITWLAAELQRPYITVQRWCDGGRYEWKLSDLRIVAQLLEMEPYELLPECFLPDKS